MTKKEFAAQEELHSARFVWNWMKYKMGVTKTNYKSTVGS